jgi:hypothetical protein
MTAALVSYPPVSAIDIFQEPLRGACHLGRGLRI